MRTQTKIEWGFFSLSNDAITLSLVGVCAFVVETRLVSAKTKGSFQGHDRLKRLTYAQCRWLTALVGLLK